MKSAQKSEWSSSGEFIHQAQFQSRSPTRDSFGQQLDTWTTYYTAWAKVEALRGQMLYQTSEFISQSTYVIKIHYPLGSVTISAQDRITAKGQTFVVDAPLNTKMRNRELEILCHVVNESD